MPAVTPAELNSGPSRTKIRSGSTIADGYAAASSGAYRQWVATRLPPRRPAAPSRKAPVQTEP